MHACVTELTEVYKNPKILFAAVYPAIAIEPKELTEDCSRTLEKVDDGALNSCRDSDLENLEDIDALETQLQSGIDNNPASDTGRSKP